MYFKILTFCVVFSPFQAVGEQFRRFANMYFLIVGIIMATGYYSELYESAISPWTTFGDYLPDHICVLAGDAGIPRAGSRKGGSGPAGCH